MGAWRIWEAQLAGALDVASSAAETLSGQAESVVWRFLNWEERVLQQQNQKSQQFPSNGWNQPVIPRCYDRTWFNHDYMVLIYIYFSDSLAMRHGGLSYRDGHPSRNIEKNDESWMTIGPSCLLLDHDEHEHLVVYSTVSHENCLFEYTKHWNIEPFNQHWDFPMGNWPIWVG